MTNEEAITILNMVEAHGSLVVQAKDMAIKALSAEPCECTEHPCLGKLCRYYQEPCNDAISRQAVLEQINCWIGSGEYKYANATYYLTKRMQELPSVKPHPKIGRWIMPVQDDGMSDTIYYQVRCSKCGFDLDPQIWHQELHQYSADRYCPNCGCRMVDVPDIDVGKMEVEE